MSYHRFFPVALALALTVMASLNLEVRAATLPDPLSGDGGVSDFYLWTEKIPPQPGKLLRQEPLPSALVLANAVSGVRFLYSSRDGIDDRTPVTVSGAVFIPKGKRPRGGWPVIAWAHGTVGVADVCAPSWRGRSPRDVDYLNAWLAEGYAVVATDYQGLGTPGGHPYLMSKPEAYSILDSLRAARKSFKLANRVVIVGQSQGAHGALAAGLYAPTSAPDVKVLGIVATGIPHDKGQLPDEAEAPSPAQMIPRDAVTPNVGFLFLMAIAARAADQARDPAHFVTAKGLKGLNMARTACLSDVIDATMKERLTMKDAFASEEFFAVTAPHRRWPVPRFAMPVFTGTGLADTTTIPALQYEFLKAACAEGSVVDAHYYPGLDHSGVVNASLEHSKPFVSRVFAGETIAGTCATLKPPEEE